MLASPQQLHQYCIQQRTCQGSSLLHLQARQRERLPRPAGSLCCREGGQSAPLHLHTHTHTLTGACAASRDIRGERRRAERDAETGNILVDKVNPGEGQDSLRRLVLSCFRSRPGELRTAEFNKISLHLLPCTPVNCFILSSYRELTVRSCQCDVFTGCAVHLSGFHLGHTESSCMEVLLDLL